MPWLRWIHIVCQADIASFRSICMPALSRKTPIGDSPHAEYVRYWSKNSRHCWCRKSLLSFYLHRSLFYYSLATFKLHILLAKISGIRTADLTRNQCYRCLSTFYMHSIRKRFYLMTWDFVPECHDLPWYVKSKRGFPYKQGGGVTNFPWMQAWWAYLLQQVIVWTFAVK